MNPNMFMHMNLDRNQMTPQNMNQQMPPQFMNQQMTQQMTQQMNQINSQMSQINPFGNTNTVPMRNNNNTDPEFISKIVSILKNPNVEERTDQLGEIIFYYLLKFIAKFNLNVSEGRFDDPTLCSKLTGMFLSIEEKDLLEILSKNDILVLTIKDVVNVIIKY